MLAACLVTFTLCLPHPSAVDAGVALRVEPALDARAFTRLLANHQFSVQRPTPVLLIILDTLRADYVTETWMPTLHRMQQQNVSFADTLSVATSTDHAFFATFFGRPAYERELLHRDGWHLGSPYLHLLNRAGYRIELFAYSQWYGCPPSYAEVSTANPWNNLSQFDLIFGRGGALLARCPDVADRSTRVPNAYDADRAIIEQLLDAMRQAMVEPSPPHLFILHLYTNHRPYGLNAALPNVQPALPGRGNEWIAPYMGEPMLTEVLAAARATYANGAISMDDNLHYLFSSLQQQPWYDDLLWVAFSDHGEHLPDSADTTWGHGRAAWREQVSVPLIYRFPHDVHPALNHTVGTQSDIFPTLLAWTGLTSQPATSLDVFFEGAPIFAGKRRCFISVTPHGSLPPSNFSVSDGVVKALLTVDARDGDGATTHARIDAVTDLYDAPAAWNAGLQHCVDALAALHDDAITQQPVDMVR